MLPTVRSIRLANGTVLNFIDENTYQNVSTGEVLTLTPPSADFAAYCPVCKANVQARIALSSHDLRKALDRDEEVPVVHAFPLPPDHKFFLTKEQRENLRKHRESMHL
jgi:hypothetical protein